jgi:hypothetical protein
MPIWMAPTICSVALMASRNANIKMGIKVLNPFVDVPVDSLLGPGLVGAPMCTEWLV